MLKIQSFLRHFLKWTLVVFVGLFLVRFVFTTVAVQADSLVFNPNFCLGGWEKPQNASGAASIRQGLESSAFNLDNSAFLESGVASQIFCGYFPVENREKPPRSVRVTFNWMMKGNASASYVPSPSVQTESPPVSEGSLQEAVTEESAAPVQEELPTSLPEEAPISTPEEPYPVEVESNPIPSQESSIEPETSAFFDFFVRRAHAQSSATDFIDVSYSTDGIRWVSVGKVNVLNWQNFTIDIPVSSWGELDRLQVMLNIIPTTDTKPEVYLESVDLVVDYDGTLMESAKEGVGDTATAIFSVMDMVQETIVDIITPSTEVSVEIVKEPVTVKERVLLFERGQASVQTKTSLPWYGADFRDSVGGRISSEEPQFEVSSDKKSFRVHGSCDKSHFVVLLWRSAEDYVNKPGSFASNFADTCSNGKFSYDLSAIPKDTPDGTYFLMIAEEDDVNPWVPVTALMPIEIHGVIEERLVED